MESIGIKRRITNMLILVLAGEIIFGLPFHLARFFRPTYLDVFNISNTNLGDVYAVYGLTAMISYFFGGMLADKYPPRILMSLSLVLTSIGGFFISTIPELSSIFIIYGYWGITTIFLFWSAMIKATKEWGGEYSQGKAFGILDGGRGLFATIVSLVAIYLFTAFLTQEVTLASPSEKRKAFQSVIILYSSLTLLIGIIVWLFLPDNNADMKRKESIFKNLNKVIKNPLVWLNAGIIVCAYSAYKGLDNTTLYAHEVLGMNEVDAAKVFSYGSLIRPIAAIVAGIIADRWISSRVILVMFSCLTLIFALLAMSDTMLLYPAVVLLNIYITFFLVFAIRGIYFAVVQETKVNSNITGTAAGVISFIGFTPDIFFGSISGRILDANPGVVGHQNYFLFLTVIAFFGIVIPFIFRKISKRNETRTTY
jgi:sugar phosphate permease